MRKKLFSTALLSIALLAAPTNELKFPTDYRSWIYLTSGVGMTYAKPHSASEKMDAHPSIDNVFVNPEAYRYFVAHGTWPDQASFVLEIRNSESHGSINQGGLFQGEVDDLEMHVKDKKRYPDTGGWAFFSFPKAASGASSPASAKQIPPSANCYSCHTQHGAVDTTFVQFYPTLRPIAQAKGTYKSSE